MKVKLDTIPKVTLEEFADLHGLSVTVRERSPSDMGTRWNERFRYYAEFDGCEIKSGPFLRSAYGDGATHLEAIAAMGVLISGKRIVIDAFGSGRKEIDVPIILPNP